MKTLWILGLLFSAFVMVPSQALAEENAVPAKLEEAKIEEKKIEAPKVEEAKAEAPKVVEKAEAPKAEAPKAEAPKVEAAKTEAPKTAPAIQTPPPAELKTQVKDEPKGFNKRWNLTAEVLGGGYNSMGNVSLTPVNSSQYPSFTSGEKVAVNVKDAGGSGFQIGGGFRLNDWFSANARIMAFGSKSETQFTTLSGNKYNLTMDSGIMYISPFTWTAYPVSWLYISAGLGVVFEGHKVKSDIPNMSEFEMGSGGGGSTLGAGVEFALGKHWTLTGGIDLFSATLNPLTRKINEGTANEVSLKLEERKVNIGTLTVGTKIYF